MNGILVIDKPAGLTSARIVSIVKRLLPRGTKVGHAGTLDPFATGVLLVLVGKATRQCERLMSAPKQYVAMVKFGVTTETDDPESPERVHSVIMPPTRQEVETLLPQFTGEILQRPPVYSALKRGGRPMYELAREGIAPELQPRPVQIYELKILSYEWPLLELKIDCGRGTYIRALARDMGEALKVGGYLTQLRRTQVGEFSIERAMTLQDLSIQAIIQACNG